MQNKFKPVILLLFLLSCKAKPSFVETRLTTAEKFVDCLKKNAPDEILSYTDSGACRNIDDKVLRDLNVNKAYELTKRFNLPSRDKWIIQYDPQKKSDSLLINIPLFQGNDSTPDLAQANIILAFSPDQTSSRICRYEIKGNYDWHRLKLKTVPLSP